MIKSGIPRKPVGDTAKWYFMRRVWESIWGGLFPIRGEDGATVRWENGVYLVRAGAGAAGRAALCEKFNFLEAHEDYVLCDRILVAENGDRTVLEEDVMVAKDWPLRESLEYAVVDDNLVHYTYAASSNANKTIRTATLNEGEAGEQSEQQIVIPRWKPGDAAQEVDPDIIYALRVAGGTGVFVEGVELEWLELSSRAWARGT